MKVIRQLGKKIAWIISVVSLLMLFSCAEPDQYRLNDYVVRLSRLLESDIPMRAHVEIPQMPRIGEVRFEPPRAGVDILEFLRLGDCELQQWIAERNSSLGRFAPASQRLIYELNFLRLADICIQALTEDHPSLAEELNSVREQKHETLPRLIWQSVLAGPEFRDYWRHRHSHWSQLNQPEVTGALEYLDSQVSRWLVGNYEVSGPRLESALSTLRTGDGGTLLGGSREVMGSLVQANQMIESRLARRALCFEGMVTTRRDILRNVVELYTGPVQQGINQLVEARYGQIKVIRRIETRLADAEPMAYATFRRKRDALLASATESSKEHAEALRPLLTQCGLLPSERTSA